MLKGNRKAKNQQGGQGASEYFIERVYAFTKPLLQRLSQRLDRRLVQTFFDLLVVIVIHRDRHQGLLLTELGGELMGPNRAPAGTKRIAHLLHSRRWEAGGLEQWLWEQGDRAVAACADCQEDPYVIWDESEIEKPESIKVERLCPVRSSKARRLKRIKPGYYNPPGGRPVFVPGFHWLQVVVTGLQGTPSLAHFRWWTTRGENASQLRTEEEQVLKQLAQRWGRQVIHVWDRGFAGTPWIQAATMAEMRFILRWKKGNYLIDEKGERRKTSDISRSKRSVDHRLIYDARHRIQRKTGIVFMPIRLPDLPEQPLWLVISRPGAGRLPWFLLTNEPIQSIDQAWRIVFGYTRRWQIETVIRQEKTELGIEGIRLVAWECRQKLMLILAIEHAFLLSLLVPSSEFLRTRLLSTWCHRTGKRSRLCAAPLYRLRLALSALWLAFRPLSLPRLI